MGLAEVNEASAKAVRVVQRFPTRSHDPRRAASISERDAAALRFIGEGFEVAQYQLHAAVFGGVSETVVSRFVLRSARQDLLQVERLNGMGINRLRLTPNGVREVSARTGRDAPSIFAPVRWVAFKDLAHTLWINDLRVVFSTMTPPPDVLMPAWAIQRMASTAAAIPDLLAIWKVRAAAVGLVLACEIDLGNEPLKSVLLPKLIRLGAIIRPDRSERAAVVVLTRGRQRADALEALAPSYEAGNDIIVLELPPSRGRASLPELRRALGIDGERLSS